jgi:3-deoxy-manno-octulosonate cytidylyltransferase (CMP-KDO synthetase)
MKISITVPARFDSSRFPGKILKSLGGIPILRRVLERAAQVSDEVEVIALVDEQDVLERVNSWGFRAILTPRDCVSGTERIVCTQEKLAGDFIINVQGDEPFISIELLANMAAVAAAEDTSPDCPLTAIYPIASTETLFNPNRVKAVIDKNDRAIYCSRNPIPFLRDIPEREQWPIHHQFWGHVGVYGYHRTILTNYSSLKKGILERAEQLEQLRFLENGISLRCIRTEEPSIGIDTPEDLVAAEEFLRLHPEF